MRKRVLVTGLSGVVGSAVRPALVERYELSALTRRGADGLPSERSFRADISELEAIGPAFLQIDVVVHLAATGGVHGESGAGNCWERLLRTNIIGTYNVFEAAARAGVGRVVFASSGATVRGYESRSPYREIATGEYRKVQPPWPMLTRSTEPRPVGLYGVSKLFGEDLGRYYAETRALSVICLRIGSVSRSDRPTDIRRRSVYLSHRDLAQIVVKSIDAPASLRFEIFHAVSNNRWNYRDWTAAQELLGYVPQDSAEVFESEESEG